MPRAVAELEARKQEQLARQNAKEQEKLRLAREQQKRMQESKPTTLEPLLNTTLHREDSVLVHGKLKRNYELYDYLWKTDLNEMFAEFLEPFDHHQFTIGIGMQ